MLELRVNSQRETDRRKRAPPPPPLLVRGAPAKPPAEARWELTAAHGGGYQFRLCPAGAPLTEARFQKTVCTRDDMARTDRLP